MGDGEHGNRGRVELVVNCVGKPPQNVVVDSVFISRPHRGILCELVDRGEYFRAEGIRCKWATFEVPEEGFPDVLLGERQNGNLVARHSELKRAFASDHGTA